MTTDWKFKAGADLTDVIRLLAVDADEAPVAGLTIAYVVRNSAGTNVSSGNLSPAGAAGWYKPATYVPAVGRFTVEYTCADYGAQADTVHADSEDLASLAALITSAQDAVDDLQVDVDATVASVAAVMVFAQQLAVGRRKIYANDDLELMEDFFQVADDTVVDFTLELLDVDGARVVKGAAETIGKALGRVVQRRLVP